MPSSTYAGAAPMSQLGDRAEPFLRVSERDQAQLAYRIWKLRRAAMRSRLLGVPVVQWRFGDPLEPVLEEVSAFRRFARAMRAWPGSPRSPARRCCACRAAVGGDLPGPTGVAVVAGLGSADRRSRPPARNARDHRPRVARRRVRHLACGQGLDPAAVLFAGGLAIAELAFWALEPGAAVRIGRAATGRRALTVAAVVFGAVVSGALLLLAVSDPLRGGAALGIAGVLALLTIVAVAVVLARSLRDDAGEL